MPATTRNVAYPRYVAVPGQPPPLHTMATPVPPSQPAPAQRPGAGGVAPFGLPPQVNQVDPSDSTTWPTPDAVQFS